MQVNGYLNIEGKACKILYIGSESVRLEGGKSIPMNLVGLYPYSEPEPERRPFKKQKQLSLI